VAAVLLLLFRCNIVNLKSFIEATVLSNTTQFGNVLLIWITSRFSFNIDLWSSPNLIHWRVAESDSSNVFSGITYLMKHLIYTICSSHRNDHRTSSIYCVLHKLMNTILCELKNLKDLLSLSPLIIINNILSGVLGIIAFYLTFYVAFFITSYCMV